MKKQFLTLLFIVASIATFSQVKISQMLQYTGSSIDSLQLPAVLGGGNYKIQAYKLKPSLQGSTDVGKVTTNDITALEYYATGNGLTIGNGSASGFEFTKRQGVTTFPAALIRATQTNTQSVLDISPNGTASDVANYGVTWLHITNKDMKTGSNLLTNTIGAGIMADGSAWVGTDILNGAALQPLYFIHGGYGTKRMTFNTSGGVDVNTNRWNQTVNAPSDYAGFGLWNSATIGNSHTLLMVGQDFSSFKFGYIRYRNEGYAASGNTNPNQVEMVANSGAVNGLLIGTLGTGAPVKVISAGVEVLRFTTTNISIKTILNLQSSTAPTSSADASGINGDVRVDASGNLYIKAAGQWLKFTGATF